MHRKGQISLNDAPMIIMTIVFVVLIAAASAISLNSFKDNSDSTSTASSTDSNSKAVTNETATYFSDYDAYGNAAVTCTILSAENGTNNLRVETELDVSGAGNCFAQINNDTIPTATFRINYTKVEKTYDYSYNMSFDGESGLNNFSKQLPTIGTVAGVVMIVAVIVGAFAMFIMRGNAF